MTEKYRMRKIRLFPKAAQFSKIPDFSGKNLKTPSVTVIEPAEISAGKKAPRKKLPAEDRLFNKMISRGTCHRGACHRRHKTSPYCQRSLPEHGDGFHDPVTETACGLHHLRVTFRVPKHPKKNRNRYGTDSFFPKMS